jgi:hypothetical protein
VTGRTWRLLDSGPNDCSAAGHAVSIETATLPAKELRHAKRVAQQAAADASVGVQTSPSGTSPSAVPPATASTSTNAESDPASSGSTSHSARNATAVVVVALLVAGGALALRRSS